MALKRPLSRTIPGLTSPLHQTHRRSLHKLNAPTLPIPKPTPFVPDVQTFLTLIGRKLSAHTSKIPTWEALFSLSSAELREAGVEPPRARRYLLWWRERFRQGIVGIGGDLVHVRDGVGELSIVQVPQVQSDKGEEARPRAATVTTGRGMEKVVVNTVLPEQERKGEGEQAQEGGEGAMKKSRKTEKTLASMILPIWPSEQARPVNGVRISGGVNIAGKGVQAVKGRLGVASLKVQEGLWEQKRGRKVDGGERRKAEVRAKRRAAERKMR